MADVGEKAVTRRRAKATGVLRVTPKQTEALADNRIAKGDWRAVAKLAGIGGAKRCAELVPLCHPLPLDHVDVEIELDRSNHQVAATCTATAEAKTGVEMEALTGVSVALLAVYDMVKSLDKGAKITCIQLVQKSGGRSGMWQRSTRG